MSTGTQIEVVMPQMGVSVSEGTITKWLKQPGEAIARDEPLLEISTDKVDTEVPSPGDGVLAEILVAEGQTVDVGTVLGRIGPAGSEAATAAPEEPAAAPACRPEHLSPTPRSSSRPHHRPPAAEPEPAVAAPAAPHAAAAPQTETAGNGRAFVSPVVARIAAEHGVDPTAVSGTGTGGRVTKKDILAFIESGAAAPAQAPALPAPAAVLPGPPTTEPAPPDSGARADPRARARATPAGRSAGAADDPRPGADARAANSRDRRPKFSRRPSLRSRRQERRSSR